MSEYLLTFENKNYYSEYSLTYQEKKFLSIDDKKFSCFLLLTILENLGMIASAKDYGVVVIFIIAVDRVTKIWPEEKHRLVAFSQKVKKCIKSVD